jgi:hypothetical protein
VSRDRAVVLGVDQATSSGYCVHVGREPVRWGLARTALERREVLRIASMFATEHAVDAFYFCFENHSSMRRISASRAAVMTLGGMLHRWLEQLDLMGHPESHRFGVPPQRWQTAVLGVDPKSTREQRKLASIVWANRRTGEAISSNDVSDAIAITDFAALTGIAELCGKAALDQAVKQARRRA